MRFLTHEYSRAAAIVKVKSAGITSNSSPIIFRTPLLMIYCQVGPTQWTHLLRHDVFVISFMLAFVFSSFTLRFVYSHMKVSLHPTLPPQHQLACN